MVKELHDDETGQNIAEKSERERERPGTVVHNVEGQHDRGRLDKALEPPAEALVYDSGEKYNHNGHQRHGKRYVIILGRGDEFEPRKALEEFQTGPPIQLLKGWEYIKKGNGVGENKENQYTSEIGGKGSPMMADVALDKIVYSFDDDLRHVLLAGRHGFQIPGENEGEDYNNEHYEPHHNYAVGDGNADTEKVNIKNRVCCHYIA